MSLPLHPREYEGLTPQQIGQLHRLHNEHGVAFVNDLYPDGGVQIVTRDPDDQQRIYEVERDGSARLTR